MSATRLPTYFISHGGPNLLDDKDKPGKFYDWFGKTIREKIKPKAVVIVSAHWQGDGNGVYVEATEGPLKLIYDFYGFPPQYYKQTWNGTGLPSLANKVAELLKQKGIPATLTKRGIDHGVWVPLKRALSDFDIPLVQVSTFEHEDMASHVKLGEALQPLRSHPQQIENRRDEGVLIIGSGAAEHNLRDMWQHINRPSPSYIKSFDKNLEDSVLKYTGEQRKAEVCKLNKDPAFRKCHPTAEHLVPLHVAVGAAGDDKAVKILDDFFSTIGWSSFEFSSNNQDKTEL
ncbi:hypothetical protein K450DRAFT_198306 [Umbelopsis ramanniana AG]|uniref:Extradiol ring-cleavage dioxygenase class III enzyme subunit B domain-containing protein n=1 Tax=Umbelopsis ramanniana AG TaxID=1314678 RepID=A0AAD5HG56_UMBRA|nr:uncharacterized protein K450DRAFT_198306 [Umbelopsis ramanniana AG]KAI8580698.1 hypothetical protein K450DRAFT_198306 [Umbelopsis ramanniana AG]